MSVLSKIFGEYPQVKILEAFVDHFDEELSIPDILWLTDVSKTTICGTQLYHLNNEKQEVQIIVSLVNYIVSEKLAERLEERGLNRLEELTNADILS